MKMHHSIAYTSIISVFVSILIDSVLLAVPHKIRKSDLFLSGNAIPGIGGEPPEATFSRATFSNKNSSSSKLLNLLKKNEGKSARHMVNGPPLRRINEDQEGQNSARNLDLSLPTPQGNLRARVKPTKPPLDPIISRIIATDEASRPAKKSSKDNTTTLSSKPDIFVEGSDTTDPSLLTGGLSTFITQLVKCKEKLKLCSKTDLFNAQCYLHCLLRPHPVGKAVVSSLIANVKSFCDPIGTIFDKGVPTFAKHATSILTPANYLTLFKIGPDSIKRFSRFAINSLPTLLIKYTDGIQAQALKKAMNGLESALRNTGDGGNGGEDKMINSACPLIDPMDTVQSLVNAFYKSPKAFDVVLQGSWMISRAFNFISEEPFLRNLMKGFGGALDISAGIHPGCGMLYKTETGEEPECNEEEIIRWDGGKILPAEVGSEVVCGAIPFFPPDIFDELYPSIFFEEEKTTTTTSSPTTPKFIEATDKISKGSGMGKLDWKAIDAILKTDIDYDD